MTAKDGDIPVMEDPDARLERALIEEFLRARGLDVAALAAMPEADANRVLTEASVYAATKLAEVEARAHYVHDIHKQE